MRVVLHTVVRIRASLIAVFFLGAAIFAGPAHDLLPAEDHAPESACHDALPVDHFDDCGHEDSGHCHFCLHSTGRSSLWSGSVGVDLSNLPRAESASDERPLILTTITLPLTRGPPEFAG